MATGPKEVRKEDEDQATLPEVHRRDEADREKAHHLRPVHSGADLRPVPVKGRGEYLSGESVRRQSTIGSGRRSALATTSWLATSDIADDRNEDLATYTGPEGPQDRVDISLRPSIIDEKEHFGDFEIDMMIGRNHKGAIMTINDRCMHLVLIRRLAGKEAAQLASTAIEALLPYKDRIHTITADNGKEFARHKEIAKGLGAEFYFARPYHSWERGANKTQTG